jgi:hypothetical protein
MNRFENYFIILIFILPFHTSFGINPSLSNIYIQTKQGYKVDNNVIFLKNDSILESTKISSDLRKNEFLFSYGILSSNSIFGVYSLLVSSFFGDIENSKEIGTFNVSYKYIPGKRWGFGLSAAYLSGSYDQTFNYIWPNVTTVTKHYKWSVFDIAADIDFRYINSEETSLYSGFSYGLQCRTENESGVEIVNKDYYKDFHLSIIGFRYGEKFGFFTELGLGFKGFFTFGVCAKW